MSAISPLRYPGGKAKLYTTVKNIITANELTGGIYAEPFAGGAGLALKLLLKNDVDKIILNDLDLAIYSFWDEILHNNSAFTEKINNTMITIEEWYNQKSIYANPQNHSKLDYAFATFFLNRTNMSGVIKGGVIGGTMQQGKYKIDARFNKNDLIERIKNIALHKDKIEIHNEDGAIFAKKIEQQYPKALINFDPPYVQKGGALYKNSFNEDAHRLLSEYILKCSNKWILTYDVCSLIDKLYSSKRHSLIDITYSAQNKRKAKEFIFFSDNVYIPNDIISESEG